MILFSTISTAQTVVPLVDFRLDFKSFQNGFFKQVEFQQISGYKFGDDVVGYIDFKGNLMVYDGTVKKQLANVIPDYQVSDNLLTWKIGPTLNLWDNGTLSTLTYYLNEYRLKDELVVYTESRFNTLNAYYEGDIYTLVSSVTEIEMPDFVGENIIAYRDNGNYYKVFWEGTVYELDVWHNPIHFEGGTDILAFNDPINGTFAIFENGEFFDLEMLYVDDYKAGRGFVVYENANGDLMHYKDGEKKQLTNFGASSWYVKDDIVVWTENSFTYAYTNGEVVKIANYIPKDFLLKNNTYVFRNLMGGISTLIDGKVQLITNRLDATYSIHGNSVLVSLFNSSYIYFKEGRKFEL